MFDVIIVGSSKRIDYVGARTFYLQEIFKKYAPQLNIGLYDITSDIRPDTSVGCKNIIFLPWSESIDLGWCNFLLNSTGRKILYTENYYWYQHQKNRILQLGFNLENLFDIISFATREYSGWWNNRQYSYWGVGITNSIFSDLEIKSNNNIIYIDTPWNLNDCIEPYNALRILNQEIPKLKDKYGFKIKCQNFDADWVDINLDKDLDLLEMINHYNTSDLFIVSHSETCGLPQIEAQLCGTKVLTTKLFSNNSALLGGTYTHDLWDFESNSFSKNFSLDYEKEQVKTLSLEAFNDEKFFLNMKKNLWNI